MSQLAATPLAIALVVDQCGFGDALKNSNISLRIHHLYPTIAGVIIGVVVGGTGLAFLAKQILGDRQ